MKKSGLTLSLSLSVAVALMSSVSTTIQAHGDEMKAVEKASSAHSLSAVLATMPEKTKQRFSARHPKETLEFFGIKSGMTVLEALPGGGWYSKILLPYLGKKGELIGADYAVDMYPKFGFFSKEKLKETETWVADWTKDAQGWSGANGAKVQAFNFGSMPNSINGQADAILFIRALHNLAKFESDGGYLTTALGNAYDALKPGGIVGIVQHMVPESADDKGANGARGYLKQSFLISTMEKAGFEFVGSSDVNLNPKDKPSAKDIVWRLPPSFATSRKDAKKKAEFKAVGESNRMTLKFRKPK